MTNPTDPAFLERNEFVAHQTTLEGKLCNCSYGLTKREYFAGLAMQGLATTISKIPKELAGNAAVYLARAAVAMADVLIAKLNEPHAPNQQ